MSDIGEAEDRDEQAVEVEDLDAPEKGIASLVYLLGEKLYTHRPHTRLVTLMCMLCLLLSILLSGSALIDSEPQRVHSASYPMDMPYTYSPCDGKVELPRACSHHVIIIIISVSPGTSNNTPQLWHKVTTP